MNPPPDRRSPDLRWAGIVPRSLPAGWRIAAAAIVACALVGAVVGHFAKPPGGFPAGSAAPVGIYLTPVDRQQLVRAHVPRVAPAQPPDASYWHPEHERYGGFLYASAESQSAALSVARRAGIAYARSLAAHENQLMPERSAPPRIQRRQRVVMRQPARYLVWYSPVDAPKTVASEFAPAPWRGALVGALVGMLLLSGAALLSQRRAVAGGLAGMASAGRRRLPAVGGVVAGLALAGLLTAAASASSSAYTAVVVALMFLFAFVYAWVGGRAAVRSLVVAVIVLSPLRGALLGLSDAISLPDGLTTVNAIQPALVAGCALVLLLQRRGRFPRDARPLLVGWGLIAGVALLDFGTQTVGVHVYAIGLAQYLTYPTLAIVAWLVLDRGDQDRLVRLLVALAAVVAVSVFVEAAGLINFVEAAAPGGNAAIGNRWGGATGSYLHASIFLGTAAVLTIALVLGRWGRRDGYIAAGVLAIIVGAMAMTLSRGGFAVAGVGGVFLLVGAGRRDRVRLLGTAFAVLAVAAILGTAGGVTPAKLVSRVSSGASTSKDAGNKPRLTRMRRAVDHFRDLPASQKALGEGLAATGNARTVASEQSVPTESYPLKLLLEVGLIGTLVIGAYLVWAAIRFGKTSIRGPTRLARAAGAAGVGLTVYGLAYPTLEVQLLAMTWWVLLVACLPLGRVRLRDAEPRASTGDWRRPERLEPAPVHEADPRLNDRRPVAERGEDERDLRERVGLE